MSSSPSVALQQVRKPYTITKQRERWTEDEHVRFLEALKLFGRAWRRIEEHIGTKTAVQIRSHAQKFFSKLEREGGCGHDIEIPPPRPKRKPTHPYPKKAGLSSPGVEEQEIAKALDESTKTVQKGLKLFGKTVLVDVPSELSASTEAADRQQSPEEESGVESGSPRNSHRNKQDSPQSHEVSSRNRDDNQQANSSTTDQMVANNLMVFHYASFFAAGQGNPWQLLTPQVESKSSSEQQNILRWHSLNSPLTDDNETEEAEVVEEEGGPPKRRRQTTSYEDLKLNRSSSSCTTTSCSDDEAGSCTERSFNLSTRLTLESQGSSSGFVPYKRPSQIDHR